MSAGSIGRRRLQAAMLTWDVGGALTDGIEHLPALAVQRIDDDGATFSVTGEGLSIDRSGWYAWTLTAMASSTPDTADARLDVYTADAGGAAIYAAIERAGSAAFAGSAELFAAGVVIANDTGVFTSVPWTPTVLLKGAGGQLNALILSIVRVADALI